MDARTPPAIPPPWAIGDAVTVRGFRLAGLEGRIVDTPEEAREAMRRARAASVTLVVATERAAALVREAGPPAEAALPSPVVVVVPAALGPRAAPSAADRLGRRVRQVLGLPAEPASGAEGA